MLACHSLGGVIVKQVRIGPLGPSHLLTIVQALIHARREDYRHVRFIKQLRGIVFLSTPHLPGQPSDEWRKPAGIILVEAKYHESSLTSEIELLSLVRVSEMFENLLLR